MKKPDQELREGAIAQLMERGASERKKASFVRHAFFTHRTPQYADASSMIREGVPLANRAESLWEGKRRRVELALVQLEDPVDRELLERRNEFMFGNKSAPSFQWLVERAKASGLDETGQLESVIDWVLRPDLYRYERREARGYPLFERLKPEPRGRTKAQAQRLARKVEWKEVGNPEEPLAAKVGRRKWTVRVNDFPDAPLYSLLVDGVSVMDFDNWPKTWSRPSRPH